GHFLFSPCGYWAERPAQNPALSVRQHAILNHSHLQFWFAKRAGLFAQGAVSAETNKIAGADAEAAPEGGGEIGGTGIARPMRGVANGAAILEIGARLLQPHVAPVFIDRRTERLTELPLHSTAAQPETASQFFDAEWGAIKLLHFRIKKATQAQHAFEVFWAHGGVCLSWRAGRLPSALHQCFMQQFQRPPGLTQASQSRISGNCIQYQLLSQRHGVG